LISCRDVAERASEYLDQELTWRSRLQVRLHLFVCQDCRRYVDQLRATTALLRRSLRRSAEMAPRNEVQLLAAVRAQTADALRDSRR
jgi:anti-sigma factor RsiW